MLPFFFFSLNTYCFTGCSLSHNQWPQSGQVWNYNSLPFLRKQVCWTICDHCLCSFSLSRMLLMPQVLHSHFTTIFFFCYTMLFAGLSYPFWKVNGCTYKHASSFAVLFLLYYLCANFSSFSSFSKFLTFYYSAFLGLSGYPALLFCKICLWPLESFFDN